MTTIQIRIDEKTKKEATKVFNDLGIDMSTGIKIYLKKIIYNKGIPFELQMATEEELKNIHLVSEASLAKVWDNKQDDIYDEFYNKKA